MTPKIYLCGGEEIFPNYAAALRLAGAVVTEDTYSCNGLLLPGGSDLDPALYGQDNIDSRDIDQSRDQRELILCRNFLETKRPILGICRGAQVLAVALGGSLLQHVPGHEGIDGHDRVHETVAAGVLARLYGSRFFVNSWHHQAAGYLPEGCRVLQRAPDGVVEAFDHETLPILAVQWHPERMCGTFERLDTVSGLPLLRHFVAMCESEDAK